MTPERIYLQATGLNPQPHRLGMGRHHIWTYEVPITWYATGEDGWTEAFEEAGVWSTGCVLLLTDDLARRVLGTTLRAVHCAMEPLSGEIADYGAWLTTAELQRQWNEHTVIPPNWTARQVQLLLGDLRAHRLEELAGALEDRLRQTHRHLLRERAPAQPGQDRWWERGLRRDGSSRYQRPAGRSPAATEGTPSK